MSPFQKCHFSFGSNELFYSPLKNDKASLSSQNFRHRCAECICDGKNNTVWPHRFFFYLWKWKRLDSSITTDNSTNKKFRLDTSKNCFQFRSVCKICPLFVIGCSGFIPINYTERTAETESWTLHKWVPTIKIFSFFTCFIRWRRLLIQVLIC